MKRSLGDLSIALPFAIFTLIWGGTWIIIRDQIGSVPAKLSIRYRFLFAGAGLAVLD